MKKIIIILSVIILTIFGYQIYQVKKLDQLLNEIGYNGSILNGQYIKKIEEPYDIEIYINRNSVIDSNSFSISFHYFTEEQQVSIFSKINNNKTTELLFSYNDGMTCPLVADSDNLLIDKDNDNYQIACEDADLTTEILKEGFDLQKQTLQEAGL